MRHPDYDYDYDALAPDRVAAIQAGLDFMVSGSKVWTRNNPDGTVYIRGAMVSSENYKISITRRPDDLGWWFSTHHRSHLDTYTQQVWDHVHPNDFHGYVRACIGKAVRTSRDHRKYSLAKDVVGGTMLSWPNLGSCVYIKEQDGHHFVRRQEGEFWVLHLAPKGEFKVDGPPDALTARVLAIPWSHVNGRLPEAS